MNQRNTYILLGIVVAALGGLAIFILSGDGEKPPLSDGYLLQSFKALDTTPERVRTVEIELSGKDGGKLTFVRQKTGGWRMTIPAPARADGLLLDEIVRNLLEAKEERSAEITNSLAAHGLENPGVRITLKTDSGATATIGLGNMTIGGNRAVAYCSVSDRPDRPRAVLKSALRRLMKSDASPNAAEFRTAVRDLNGFRPLKMAAESIPTGAAATDMIESIRLVRGDDEIAMFRDADKVWRFRKPIEFGEVEVDAVPDPTRGESNINSLTALLTNILELRASDPQDFITNIDNLKDYGLDPVQNKPLRVDVSLADGSKESVYLGSIVPQEAAAKKDGMKDPPRPLDRHYARNEGDNVVVKINATAVRAIESAFLKRDQLRNRTFLRMDLSRVDYVVVQSGGEEFTLQRVGGAWSVFDSGGARRVANADAIVSLLQRLNAPQLASGFPDAVQPDHRKGLDKPAVTLKVWEQLIDPTANTDAKVLKKPVADRSANYTVLFGKKDVGDVVYARRVIGGVKTDVFVPTDVFTLADRRRLDYVDAKLKPFGADSVLRINFVSGKDAFDLERADDKKPVAQATWTVHAPAALKGRPIDSGRVSELLAKLSIMSPLRLTADAPKEDVLNRLEVNPASPRASVTLKIRDQGDRTFYFGGDVGTEKKNVYLKPKDDAFVFEVERDAFDSLKRAELQDTVVHRLDKSKIKAIRIKGWQDIVGTLQTMEIDRDKDGAWKAKSGAAFALDPTKVEQLLDQLTTLKALSFVVRGTGPTAQHGFDPAKGSMEIEWDDDTKTVKVALSIPDGMNRVHATSSLLPGDVFTLADAFGWLRAKPTALKKD